MFPHYENTHKLLPFSIQVDIDFPKKQNKKDTKLDTLSNVYSHLFLHLVVGGGSCHFWTTPWSPFGPLLSPTLVRKVQDKQQVFWLLFGMVTLGEFPQPEMEALHTHLTSLVLSTAPDLEHTTSSPVAASNNFISSQSGFII